MNLVALVALVTAAGAVEQLTTIMSRRQYNMPLVRSNSSEVHAGDTLTTFLAEARQVFLRRVASFHAIGPSTRFNLCSTPVKSTATILTASSLGSRASLLRVTRFLEWWNDCVSEFHRSCH
ncbi:hypothetical protein FA10DRAFT_55873 [Acaromyces ingoldii]|uniref:Secreted protein n=1 Tax=Acaromyces ingoldii TaxID=215250 RepID=A0A316YB16_9BASI|nr:hypothetical protein FA10DRAFT_55873 [Acaromyces ingoldii]PWN86499.1 hypothetical protein FA10DRAFT_55873 [Acaromyces ingoldii]